MELSIPGIPCVAASLCVGITAQFYKLVTSQRFSFTLEILPLNGRPQQLRDQASD